ncbi:hypothetical protein ACFOOK_11755 [Micromonospora krabiensis]|uniref:Mce-associated membrane protein n=1 Tax=Micromonospora krabiensis TaxID=307121 RepID=A0A1C3N2S6_9ACTN|nr:hypothetical protein [Micromonospora krabiensis]SBV26893.1 Mce-associated membrane protein [Micromonospora krabiensis]
MPIRRERTLKVIRGAKAGAPGRPVRRRVVARPVTAPATRIEEVLHRLDQEPVEDPTEAADLTVVGDPAEVEDLPEPDRPPAAPGEERGAEDRGPRSGEEDGVADGGRRAGEPAGPGRRRALAGLLVVLLAAALAGAGVYGHRWYVDRATEQARQAALAAGKQASVNFVSVSAASVDRDLQRITTGATGDFKEEFTRGQAQVRTAVVENKVDSQGSVLRAGLVSGDRRRAVVLVAVDATVKNVKAPEGRPSHYRIQLDLVRDEGSGDWLVAKLQFVG